MNPPAKTARRRKSACSSGREQVIAPGEGVAHGALPCWQVSPTAGQQGQPLLEPGQERGRWQDFDPRRGQLDGQGQAIEAPADGGHRGGILRGQREVRPTRRGEIDEERHGRHLGQFLEWGRRSAAGNGKRQHGNSRSPRICSAARLVARMETVGLAASSAATSGAAARTCSQLSSRSSSRLSSEEAGERLEQGLADDLPHAERGGNRRHDEGGIGQRGEIDEEDPIRIPIERFGSDLQRQPRLAGPPGPVRVTSRAPSSSIDRMSRDLLLTTDEGGRRGGEVGRMPGQAEQRRELVRQPWCDHLKDLFRLLQIPQAVGAERAQADAGRQGTSDQPLDDLRQQDLGAVPGRQQAGQPVERSGEVIAVARDGFPGMERHAHPQGSRRVGPGLGLQSPLSSDGSRDGVGSGGKGRLDRVPHGLEQHAAMARRWPHAAARGGARRPPPSPCGPAPRARCCPRCR